MDIDTDTYIDMNIDTDIDLDMSHPVLFLEKLECDAIIIILNLKQILGRLNLKPFKQLIELVTLSKWRKRNWNWGGLAPRAISLSRKIRKYLPDSFIFCFSQGNSLSSV